MDHVWVIWTTSAGLGALGGLLCAFSSTMRRAIDLLIARGRSARASFDGPSTSFAASSHGRTQPDQFR